METHDSDSTLWEMRGHEVLSEEGVGADLLKRRAVGRVVVKETADEMLCIIADLSLVLWLANWHR